MADRGKKREIDTGTGEAPEREAQSGDKNQDEVQERLGFGLRSMYRSVLEEPLPDDMLALLDQLDDGSEGPADPQRSGKDSSE